MILSTKIDAFLYIAVLCRSWMTGPLDRRPLCHSRLIKDGARRSCAAPRRSHATTTISKASELTSAGHQGTNEIQRDILRNEHGSSGFLGIHLDFKKLPKSLRVAIDSSPLEDAGRVEDTINLLGHAVRKVAMCAADLLGWPLARVAEEAGIPVLLEASIKVALDLEWSVPDAKTRPSTSSSSRSTRSTPGCATRSPRRCLDRR